MISLLLFAAVTASIDGTSVGAGIQSILIGRQDGQNTIRENISSIVEMQRQQQKQSKHQEKEIKERLKEMAANSTYYGLNMDKLSSKLDFGPSIRRNLFQSQVVRIENGAGATASWWVAFRNQAGQASNEVVNVARRKRLVLKDSASMNTKWNDVVFYTFNTSDQEVRKLFKMGVKVWSEATCIDFMEDRNASDKVLVVNEGGCWSDNGRLGGDQLLSLDNSATEGVAVHEIGHVLGLLHTMSRRDRDNYITVVIQNVNPLCIDEFDKASESYTDDYGTTYDYGSVMHYGELSYSVNQQPTMIAKDPFHQMTMGSDLISFLDIFIINEHYGCNATCHKSTSAKCANEGFPHPRNCSICICPGGYGGDLCDQRPPGCGEDLVATRDRKLVSKSLGQGIGLRDTFEFCNYMITAPAGKKVEVNVQSISSGFGDGGCPRGGVEVKAQVDKKLTGYRFCSANGSGKPIVSSSNRVPVILFNKFSTMHTVFTYRYID